MNSRRHLPLVLLAAPLAVATGSCDGLIDIRVQNQQLCVKAFSESFEPAVTPAGPSGLPGSSTTPVHMAFDKPLAEVPGRAAGLDLDVRFDTVVIRSAMNLSFIKKIAISLEPGKPAAPAMATTPAAPDEVLPPLPLGEFMRTPPPAGQPAPEVHEIVVPSALQANVWKYLNRAPARLRFLVTGKLPTEAFTADVESCVYIQGQVKRP
jgi:hypothetical protein